MSTKIHSVEDYLKGLEDQGIVVHPTMRDTITRLNGHGVLDHYPAEDDGLFPKNDPRYEAGHLDRLKEHQRQMEEAAAAALHKPEQEPKREGSKPVPYLARFALRARVVVDGEIVGRITETRFVNNAIWYRVAWVHDGGSREGLFEEFRVHEVTA